MITVTCTSCGSKKEVRTPGKADMRCQECSGKEIVMDKTIVRTLVEDPSIKERVPAGKPIHSSVKSGTISTGLWDIRELKYSHLEPGDADYVEPVPPRVPKEVPVEAKEESPTRGRRSAMRK